MLPDVQSAAAADNAAALPAAGIRRLRLPVCFHDADGSSQHTVASAAAWAAVPASQRGAHMSRLAVQLLKLCPKLAAAQLPEFATELAAAMEAQAAGVRLDFPLFITKSAPLSGAAGLVDFDASIKVQHPDGQLWLRIAVPVTMLCPCSKEVAERGAHSQRAVFEFAATVAANQPPPGLVALATRIEQHASAPLFAVLKRVDEKAVTEAAYDHPRFAEDAARLIGGDIGGDSTFADWKIRVINRESIHNHDVFAIAGKNCGG
ncbi:MAG: GTP cyclohydrolase, FolE2/MptA family [Betaproteobacteria bacterium]|nr:GTP cyclohydrolase, FolE2/MptA family [Betaproteobacteria bacterium]